MVKRPKEPKPIRKSMILVLIIIAGLANGLMDRIKHRSHEFKGRGWWYAPESWLLKYRNGQRRQGRTFTPIAFTDAWHFFKSVMLWAFCIALGISAPLFDGGGEFIWGPAPEWFNVPLNILSYRLAFYVGFQPAYKW